MFNKKVQIIADWQISGKKWKWDPKKSEWDVTDKKGMGHKNVSSEGYETHKGSHPDSGSDTTKSSRKVE